MASKREMFKICPDIPFYSRCIFFLYEKRNILKAESFFVSASSSPSDNSAVGFMWPVWKRNSRE